MSQTKFDLTFYVLFSFQVNTFICGSFGFKYFIKINKNIRFKKNSQNMIKKMEKVNGYYDILALLEIKLQMITCILSFLYCQWF
jgi:hypothetical protein